MKSLVRAVPTLMLLIVGSTSFLLSYVAIRDVAVELQAVPAHLAWAVPVCIDGGILAGSAAIWSASYRRKRRDPLAFLTVAALLVTSVVINVFHAGPAPLAKWIAALPPLILLACLEIVAAGHRNELARKQAEDTDTTVGTSNEPLEQAPEPSLSTPVSLSVVPTPDLTAADAPSAAAAVAEETPAGEADTAPAAPYLGTDPTASPTHVQPAITPPVSAARSSSEPVTPQPDVVTTTPDTTPAPVPVTSVPVTPTAEPAAVAADTPSEERNIKVAAADEPAPRVTATLPANKAGDARVASRARNGRQLRVAANTPQAAAAPAGADEVRALFDDHVRGGGDPNDRGLAARIAEQTGMSAQYVRRVVKPLRDELANA